jgi:hypothetical protein
VTVSPAFFKQLGWLLMLMPLGVVFGTGGFFVYCAWRRRRLAARNAQEKDEAGPAGEAKFGRRGSLFERPSRWLAIRCRNAGMVQAAERELGTVC